MPEYTIDWTTEVPTKPGLYWAYEAVDPLDADVMLVKLTEENVFYSTEHKMEFPKEHFSHFAPLTYYRFIENSD